MQEYYQHGQKHLIAVDCIIFGFDKNNLRLLLVKRKVEPESGAWSLMGGFLNEDESLDQAAARVLNELTGLTNVYLEQLYTYGEVERDSGARVLSVAYYALIRTNDYNKNLLDKFGAKWFLISEIPELIFDHNEMVKKALRRIQRRSKTMPVGFELLPNNFTIPQLQKLYESIYQREIDKRNFRRKILASDLLLKLNKKEKNTSKRGAYLYKFDRNKYFNLINNGYHLEIF